MAFEWFRSWHGAPTDSKFLLIAKRAQVAPGMVSAVYWALLDYASQNEPRGSVEGFDTETYAEWAGWEERDVIAIIAALTNKGAIVDGRIVAWEKRQPKREDPTSAERQARHRDAKRNAEVTRDNDDTDEVTQSNAASRSVTQKNARLDKTRLDETRLEDRQEEKRPQEEANAMAAAVEAWHAGGLTVTKAIADDLRELIGYWDAKGYPWYVADAITEATRQGKLTLAYVQGILRGCERENRAPSNKARRNGTDPSPFPSPVVDGKIKMDFGELGGIQEIEALRNG
jgi:hypothetical protein